jgi:hypothetical protein
MAPPSREKKVRGSARVVFIAYLDTITTELALGHTAQAIYDRHRPKLEQAISYPQFSRYVRQLRTNGIVQPPLGRPLTSSSHLPVPAQLSVAAPDLRPQPTSRGSTDARHQPAAKPTFRHHGITKEGEPEQLLGPGFLPKRSS